MARLSLREWFIVEQAVLAAHALVFLVLFCLQLMSEEFQAQRVRYENVRYKLHRIGLLIAVLLGVLSVDPLSTLGVYSDAASPWIIANITALLLAGVIFLNEVAIQVVYATQMQQPPPALHVLTWALVILSLLVANVTYGLAFHFHRWWYTGFNLAYIAFAFAAVITCFVALTLHILVSMDRAVASFTASQPASLQRSNSARELDAKKRFLRVRAVLVLLIGLVVVPLQVMSAIERLRDPNIAFYHANEDELDLHDHAYFYLVLAATWVLLWYSWIPVRLSPYTRLRGDSEDALLPSAAGGGRIQSQGSQRGASWKGEAKRRMRVGAESVSERPSVSQSESVARPSQLAAAPEEDEDERFRSSSQA